MRNLLRAACLFGAAILCAPNLFGQSSPLTFENGRDGDLRRADGYFTLHGGRGWLRSRRYDQFTLTFQYRLADAASRGGVAVRSWPIEGGWPARGFEIPLAGSEAGTVVGRQEPVQTISTNGGTAPAPAVWHAMQVTCAGPRATIEIDGQSRGQFDIADFPGAILFFVTRGAVDFRDIRVKTGPERPLRFASMADWSKAPGFVFPTVTRERRPRYPKRAMSRGAEGAVELEVEVLPDGTVGAMNLVRGVDPDLDLAAFAAVRQWRFTPATVNGEPVGTAVTIELTFRLRR